MTRVLCWQGVDVLYDSTSTNINQHASKNASNFQLSQILFDCSSIGTSVVLQTYNTTLNSNRKCITTAYGFDRRG